MDYYFNNGANDFYLVKEQKKKEIKKIGLLTGGAFISYILLQNLLSLLLVAFKLTDKYSNDTIFQSAVDTVLVIVSMLLPFHIFSKWMCKTSKVQEPLKLYAPKSKGEFILGVVAGSGLCMMASVATSYLTIILEVLGVKLTSPELSFPTGIGGFLITTIRIVVCAAMTEEICLRGYVMGNLRAYGDKFAIIMSALLFAVMHGNLIQAPFAFVSGLIIGYLTIKTGTMWTGIFIHAINNGVSVVISYMSEQIPERAANILSIFIIYALIMVGTLAFFLFFVMTREKNLKNPCCQLTLGEKCKAFILNPTMIITFAYMIYITSFYVEIG